MPEAEFGEALAHIQRTYGNGGGYSPADEPLSPFDAIEHHVGQILDNLGYDRNDQHFARTGYRVAQVLLGFKKNGSSSEAAELLERKFIESGSISSLVLEGPIRYTSMCAHHILPVSGWAWVAYLPSQYVSGLSKLARLVNHFARQLTVQERVTQEIADTLEHYLHPLGVMVVIRAEHGCMKYRGVQEPCSMTTTSAVRGAFQRSQAARSEVLMLIRDPQ